MNLSKTMTLAGMLVTLAALHCASQAHASIQLADLNSTFDIDPSSQAGAFNWKVDGVDQLSKQWFWYRLGNTAEHSIDTLTLNTATGNGTPVGTLNYTGPGFDLSLIYVLTGGSAGSGVSDVGETIRIRNTSLSPLDLHFFQYTDFDLNNTPNNDLLRFFPANNTVQQFDGSVIASETVVTPFPSHRQGDFFPVILNSLNDGGPTTLNDQPPINTVIGPGDVTWGYQWDRTIAVGGSFIISKDKTLAPNVGQPPVPEATSLMIWGLLGLTTLSTFYFRRHRIPVIGQN
jgi:hypothetical protein